MSAKAEGKESTTGLIKVDVTDCANGFREIAKKFIKEQLNGHGPLLVGFLANDDPAAIKYAQWTAQSLQADGLRFEIRTVDKLDLEKSIAEANEDPADVEGLCHLYRHSLYRNVRYIDELDAAETKAPFVLKPPKPSSSSSSTSARTTAPSSSAPSSSASSSSDAASSAAACASTNLGATAVQAQLQQELLSTGRRKKCILPCTPLAIVKILEHLHVYDHALPVGDRLTGKKITIINRSEIVGHPLAALLANDGAQVFSVDIDSIFEFRRGQLGATKETPKTACLQSDVIVCGVPSKSFQLDASWVSPNTVIVNVSPFKCIDEEAVGKVGGVKYVPSVGKVTVAMLERNVLRLYQNFKHDHTHPGLASEAEFPADGDENPAAAAAGAAAATAAGHANASALKQLGETAAAQSAAEPTAGSAACAMGADDAAAAAAGAGAAGAGAGSGGGAAADLVDACASEAERALEQAVRAELRQAHEAQLLALRLQQELEVRKLVAARMAQGK